MERAPAGRGNEVGHAPGDGLDGAATPSPWHRLEQPSRVGVAWIREQLVDRRLLHHLARVHDDHAVGEAGDDPKVVRDHQHRHAARATEVRDELGHAASRRRVQCAGGLVGDQEIRLGTDDRGGHRPLGHSTRELVAVLLHPDIGVTDPHLPEQVQRSCPGLGPAQLLVEPQRLGDLAADAHQRVERGAGVLHDQADLAPADRRQLPLAEPDQLTALETDRTRRLAGRGREPENRTSRDRLPRAGLADHRHPLPFGDAK